MLPSTGLLRGVQCPEFSCRRPKCFFRHSKKALLWLQMYFKQIIDNAIVAGLLSTPEQAKKPADEEPNPPQSPLPLDSVDFLEDSPPHSESIHPDSPIRPQYDDDLEPPPAKRPKVEEAKEVQMLAQKIAAAISADKSNEVSLTKSESNGPKLVTEPKPDSSTTTPPPSTPSSSAVSQAAPSSTPSSSTVSQVASSSTLSSSTVSQAASIAEQKKPIPRWTNRPFPLQPSTSSQPKKPADVQVPTKQEAKPPPARSEKVSPAVKPQAELPQRTNTNRVSLVQTYAPKPPSTVNILEDELPAVFTTANFFPPKNKPATKAELPPAAATPPATRPKVPLPKLTNLSTDKRPIIDVEVTSKISRNLRQKWVDLFFPHFLKHYGTDKSRVAVEKALAFEKKIYARCGSDASYRNAAAHALHNLEKNGIKDDDDDEDSNDNG